MKGCIVSKKHVISEEIGHYSNEAALFSIYDQSYDYS